MKSSEAEVCCAILSVGQAELGSQTRNADNLVSNIILDLSYSCNDNRNSCSDSINTLNVTIDTGYSLPNMYLSKPKFF